MNTILTRLPFLGFLWRNWRIPPIAIALNWMANTELHFNWMGKWVKDPELGGIWIAQTPMEFVGPVLWAFPIIAWVYYAALVIIHFGFPKTIDADANEGRYLKDWQACSPFQRVSSAAAIKIGLVIGFCILCAGLAKG